MGSMPVTPSGRPTLRAFRSLCDGALALSACIGCANAMVGGASSPPEPVARALVVITGSHGNVCTGTALTRDLVLTAAHCIHPGTTFRVSEFDLSRSSFAMATKSISVHPQFDHSAYEHNRATADIALIKLVAPLSGTVQPANLSARGIATVGERFIVAGFGVSAPRSDAGIGTRRGATLVAVGQPSSVQLRLADPNSQAGAKPGIGACEGDSGAPAFEDRGGRPAVVGVVSWSTGPAQSAGCGGLTGITPLLRYRQWTVDTADKLGSPLLP